MTLADLTRSRPGWWIDRRRDRIRAPLLLGFVLAAVSACSPDYSPDTYATRAVQQANKVEQGVVVGVRNVGVTAEGTIGAASGAAAGGLLGSQTPGNVGGALGTIGGGLMGGLVGTAVEHTTGDTTAYEYIVRKSNGDLLSVTQRDVTPLVLGQKVLVITGNQARVVPDYTVATEPAAPAAGKGKVAGTEKPAEAPANPPPASTQTPPPSGEAAGKPPTSLAPPAPEPASVAGQGAATSGPSTAESQPHPPAQSP